MSHDRINLGRRKQEGTPECQINLRNRKAINPHILALTLWGLFTDMGDDAEPFAIAVINQYRQEAGR